MKIEQIIIWLISCGAITVTILWLLDRYRLTTELKKEKINSDKLSMLKGHMEEIQKYHEKFTTIKSYAQDSEEYLEALRDIYMSPYLRYFLFSHRETIIQEIFKSDGPELLRLVGEGRCLGRILSAMRMGVENLESLRNNGQEV